MNISSSSKPAVALIAGPTASGKSALALALAERLPAVIVNADSAQIYRDLRIVSARPDRAEEQAVPHRLYGSRDGAEPCSAADWAAEAQREIEAAHRIGCLPILVGGTGLYINTLLQGIAPIPEIAPEIRADVRRLPVAEAHAALAREDGEAAARLRPTDTSRVARALEVIRSTGRPLGFWQQQRRGGIADRIVLHPLVLLPPRPWLYERCDDRFEEMFSDEGLAEVTSLLARGLDPALPVMRAIGVREISAYLRGEATRAQALEAGRRATRQYAKRQYTWFAHQSPAAWPRWLEPLGADLSAPLARLECRVAAEAENA